MSINNIFTSFTQPLILKKKKIKVISLDAMNTLLFLKKNPQAIYYKNLLKAGISKNRLEPLKKDFKRFFQYWKKAEQKLPSDELSKGKDRFYLGQKIHPQGFWGLLFEELFLDLEIDKKFFNDAVDIVIYSFRQKSLWDVEPTFEKLFSFCKENHIQLVLTSNWDLGLYELLDNLGISHFFEYKFISQEIEYEKPSFHIFNKILKNTKVQPNEVLHIGDNFQADVIGAFQMNMNVAWYNIADSDIPKNNVILGHELLQIKLLSDIISSFR